MSGANIKGHPALLSLFSQRLKSLSKDGERYWALCPFHDDHHPSLNISKDNDGDWVFHCFACGAGGDAIKFVQDYDKISFSKASKIVEGITGGNWEENKKLADKTFQKLEIEEIKPATKYTLDQYAKFEIALYESVEAKEWLFRERGITYETARKLHFGFCQNLESLNKKYSPELSGVSDKGWIITPAVEAGSVICIEARSMAEKKFSRKTGMEGKCLFGVDFIDFSEPIYVVEGHFDQAIMTQAGFRCVSLPNASVNLTPQMRDTLMSASVIILAGDNDGGAGTDRMLKLWNELASRTFRLIWPRGKKDANEVYLETCKRDTEAFRKLVDGLTLQAYANPMPGIKSIQDILKNDMSESSENREDRFKFSMKSLDRMANIFPGSVVYISAASTGSGKTQIVIQETLKAARHDDAIVLNYQTQLSGKEVAEIVTANLLAVDRNEIKREDRLEAAKRLKGVQYYVGHDPNANTSSKALDLIEAGIRRLGATVVVIDLLHDLCSGEDNEIQAQKKAMRRFKLMMQKYLAVGIVIGQPRKVAPANIGKPLDIYDSSGSEAIVSESDDVFFLYREPIKNMTEDTMDRLSPETQIRCMKARSKGKGAAFTKVLFLGKIATFREIVPIEEPRVQSNLEF